MQPRLHFLLLHGVLSATQYGHLRLLSTLLLGPLLGVRYLVYLGWRTPHTPRAVLRPHLPGG